MASDQGWVMSRSRTMSFPSLTAAANQTRTETCSLCPHRLGYLLFLTPVERLWLIVGVFNGPMLQTLLAG